MALLKLIVFAALIYFTLKSLQTLMGQAFRRLLSEHERRVGSHTTQVAHDTIVACPNCGTYNPTGNALLRNGRYYCNEHCAQRRSA